MSGCQGVRVPGCRRVLAPAPSMARLGMRVGEKNGSVTLEDVAAAAGVSRATASRVVRGDVKVSKVKLKAVQRVVAELGYVPNGAARTLATRRTDTVAVIVPEPNKRIFSDPFFYRTLGALSFAFEAGNTQLVMVFADRTGRDRKIQKFLNGGNIDGAIVVSHHQVRGQIETFLEAPIPVVFIGRPISKDRVLSWVDVDNRDGGRLAARRLVKNDGRKHLAIITGAMDMVSAQDRLAGFMEEAKSFGVNPLQVAGEYTLESGRKAAHRLTPMIREGIVDGVFCSSDLMSRGLLSLWGEEGVRVPQDVALVSFDNIESDLTSPPLTTIENPIERMSEAAVVMLESLIAGEETRQPVLVPAHLIERVSG